MLLTKSKKENGIFINKSAFDGNEIIKLVDGLKIYKPNKTTVITELENKKIAQSSCSEKYEVFDIKNFIKSNLSIIETALPIEKYSMNIYRGYQEITLYGEEVLINEEVYTKQIAVSSSSNGNHQLNINLGLLRQICTNGAVIAVPGSHFNFKSKHFNHAMNTVINDFQNEVMGIKQALDQQIEYMSNMNEDSVSFREFLKLLLRKKKDGEEVKYLVSNAEKLSKNLLNSRTDSINVENLNKTQLEAIHSPIRLSQTTDVASDIFITKHKLFNCYTELFKNRQNGIIEKESTRAYEILIDLN